MSAFFFGNCLKHPSWMASTQASRQLRGASSTTHFRRGQPMHSTHSTGRSGLFNPLRVGQARAPGSLAESDGQVCLRSLKRTNHPSPALTTRRKQPRRGDMPIARLPSIRIINNGALWVENLPHESAEPPLASCPHPPGPVSAAPHAATPTFTSYPTQSSTVNPIRSGLCERPKMRFPPPVAYPRTVHTPLARPPSRPPPPPMSASPRRRGARYFPASAQWLVPTARSESKVASILTATTQRALTPAPPFAHAPPQPRPVATQQILSFQPSPFSRQRFIEPANAAPAHHVPSAAVHYPSKCVEYMREITHSNVVFTPHWRFGMAPSRPLFTQINRSQNRVALTSTLNGSASHINNGRFSEGRIRDAVERWPFGCPACHHRFANRAELDEHVRLGAHNSGSGNAGNFFKNDAYKPFVCNICFKAFDYKHNLKRHKLIHTGVRPFKCPCCERRFSQKSNMKKHKARIHDRTALVNRTEVVG